MKRLIACAAIALLAACSSSDDPADAGKGKSDPIVERAQSLEKAADASVKIVEKNAQEQVDAAEAEHQTATVEADPAEANKKQ